MPDLFLHLGYPKTATTTLQRHLFPHLLDVHYLGKRIPTHDYVFPELLGPTIELTNAQSHAYSGCTKLQQFIAEERATASRPILISNEAFLHPWAVDLGTVANRLSDAFTPCKIIIVIREQRDMLWSLYRAHGRFGQWLFIQPYDALAKRLRIPISAEDWLWLQMHQFYKNFSATLLYQEVITLYDRLFGRENVLVLRYEQLRDDLPSFINALCGFMGIQTALALSLLDGRRENISPAEKTPEADAEARRKFFNLMPEWFLDRYRVGNRALAARLGTDLDLHGYLV